VAVDFLGYHFSPAGLTVAAMTVTNLIEKASRLYEQKRSAVLAATALEMYVRHWVRWARCGIVTVLERGGVTNPSASHNLLSRYRRHLTTRSSIDMR
jgi:hypothetical protein